MPEHVHRWLRYEDEDTHTWSHWCVDGDSAHHDEPCADVEPRTGEHADDTTTQDQWPILRFA
jgi:hypothetical protein